MYNRFMSKTNFSKEDALSFLLTFIVVERSQEIKMDQFTLFTLINLAQQAADEINSSDGIIAHEVLESYGEKFLDTL